MLFTSVDFLVLFLIVAPLYWTFRNLRFQNLLLLAASLVFYGWVHPWFVTLLVASTLLDYSCAIGIATRPKARNWFLSATLVGNLGLLGFYKYWGFFAENVQAVARQLGFDVSLPLLELVLPVGISFYTFQTMSYTIDVWRGQLAARRSLLDVGLFVTFFPQLVAGPIERAGNLLTQIEQPRRFSAAQFREAWPLLLLGFWKKLVFADSIAPLVDRIFGMDEPSLPLLATGSVLFSLQIFADFSGYSDMARGLAKLLGFELMVNFDAPFLARTLPEFWRRWHISLSTWIRDYVFIPLGGSRAGGRWRLLGVFVLTMGLSGLWHGAAWTYVVWGVGHGVAVWVSRQLGLDKNWRPRRAWHAVVSWAATFAIVTLLFAFFRAASLTWLGHAVAAGFAPGDAGLRAFDLDLAIGAIGTAAGFGAPWAVMHLLERAGSRARPWLFLWRWILLGIMVGLLVQRADDGVRPFIYFQF
ncbi:MAG: MBOAT family protein [Planctomycetes bacterium]|nr:MBOAT family protein [Planctomycetota bacterium]